jgi:hypothetical protein
MSNTQFPARINYLEAASIQTHRQDCSSRTELLCHHHYSIEQLLRLIPESRGSMCQVWTAGSPFDSSWAQGSI